MAGEGATNNDAENASAIGFSPSKQAVPDVPAAANGDGSSAALGTESVFNATAAFVMG